MLLRVCSGRGGRRRFAGTPLVSSLMATRTPGLTPLHAGGPAGLSGGGLGGGLGLGFFRL
jgi:hypothetical protein